MTAIPDGGRPPGSVASDYWRAACLLSFCHATGLRWPPPGAPQRQRAVGHWGCNPGIAWIAGHLAETSPGEILLVVGTGHAGSYLFAHQALLSEASTVSINEATRRYGQRGGVPTEALGTKDVPYFGGELGPALGVGQGIASSSPGLRVVTVIGDGECETPAALAAFAHHEVLQPAPRATWLPVVNVNGARMGSTARFSPERLQRMLIGMGYTVLSSGPAVAEATAAAQKAWALATSGVPVVWLSVTDKGWPAPERLGTRLLRGHRAHKLTELDLNDPQLLAEVGSWLGSLNYPQVVDPLGNVSPDIRRLAHRIRLDLPTPIPVDRGSNVVPPEHGEPVGAVLCRRSPMAAVDQVLADRSVRVLSPDEGASNQLYRCLTAGLVTELLAEEVCSAWAWGCTEAGVPTALVSYEAFAPLVATQLAQYLKLLRVRPPAGRPALAVVLTSLGWGNSPTHQNTDLVASLLARAGQCPVRVLFPIGAASARQRLGEVLDEGRDVVAAITCSKQLLPDLPDPGGAALGIRMSGVKADDATIIAVGDVAVSESVAAMALGAMFGVRIGVVVLVEPGALDPRSEGPTRQACPPHLPAVCVSWVAAHHLASFYCRLRPVPTAYRGYRERWGATAWETLAVNGLTRWALLSDLHAAGCTLPPDLVRPADAEPGPIDVTAISCDVRPL